MAVEDVKGVHNHGGFTVLSVVLEHTLADRQGVRLRKALAVGASQNVTVVRKQGLAHGCPVRAVLWVVAVAPPK